MAGENESTTTQSKAVDPASALFVLVDALEWALAMEPSPCRCMGFATPPHVCRGHKAIEMATGRKMGVCQTCNGYGFLSKMSETCGDCSGRGLRWTNEKAVPTEGGEIKP